MKRIICLLLIFVMLISISACVSASADELPVLYENEEIQCGKYYLDGNTENEYISITEGFGFQYVGFDFYNRTYELNKSYIDTLTDEEKETVLADIKVEAELREQPRYYQIQHLTGNLIIKNKPDYVEGLGGETIVVIDEKTLKFDSDHIYILVE